MCASYSKNASESFGNKIAHQSDLLYFTQMWGEDSDTFSRAVELTDAMRNDPNLSRVKHAYTKPGMFGWECNEFSGGRLEWIPYRGFVSQVIKKEDGEDGKGCCVELYKSVVAYLTREGGARKDLFERRYSDFASFGKTFDSLYENVDPEYRQMEKRLAEIKGELAEMQANWQRLVYEDIVNQIQANELLSEPAKYFDKDHCDSVEKMKPELYPGRLRIEHSLLGEDIKREIRKRFNLSQQ